MKQTMSLNTCLYTISICVIIVWILYSSSSEILEYNNSLWMISLKFGRQFDFSSDKNIWIWEKWQGKYHKHK